MSHLFHKKTEKLEKDFSIITLLTITVHTTIIKHIMKHSLCFLTRYASESQ